TATLFGLGLLFVYAARRTIIAFVFAIFFAYLLEAPVARVERWLRNSRGLAIAAVYLIALGIIALVLALAAPRIAQETQRLGAALIESVPGEHDRRVAAATLDEMNAMLGHFIRAQLLIALLAMLAITLVTWAMGVPYAFVIGPAAGALEFIPVVGPVLGGALV